MKRTGIKRKPAKRKTKPRVCSYGRCKATRAPVVVDDVTRYCKTHARHEADVLQRIVIFVRDHFTCQSCSVSGTKETLQRAHVISRGARFIEYEEDNVITLCARCHLNFTLKPAQWSVWLAVYRPGLHDRLSLLEHERERKGDSVDLAEIIRNYRDGKVAA